MSFSKKIIIIFIIYFLCLFSFEVKAMETDTEEFINYINVTASVEVHSTIIPYQAIKETHEEDKLKIVSVSYSENAVIDDVIELAMTKLGCPYSQARRERENTYDCSSFVRRMYQEITGFYIGNSTHDISSNLMPYRVSFNELEPGDLLFIKGHIAMYIGYNKDGIQEIIHATGSGDCVKIENLWGRISWTYAFRPINYINDNLTNK